jgi:hypothetical protein
MDLEVAYKPQISIQMPGDIIIGDLQFWPLNLQMKTWGAKKSRVQFSVLESFYRDKCQQHVCDGEELAEKI